MSCSIEGLSVRLGLAFQGRGELEIVRVSSWQEADRGSLVFLEEGTKLPAEALANNAGCVVTTPLLARPEWNAILSERPKLDFARAASILSEGKGPQSFRHPSAVISADAEIGADVFVGAHAVIESGVRVGRGSVLQSSVVLSEGCRIGEDCQLYPGVVLYPGAVLGDRVCLHAGVVVGSDGFGYVRDGRDSIKFPQVGRVRIEDDVEVGANTTIDRGSLGVTRIGAGSKIDNLVQIGHNVDIGAGVVIAAQTGISGSTVIEDGAVIGGQVGMGDHARVQSGAVIGSKAGILPGKIVRGGEVYWGVPVRPLREYKRLNALFGRLPQLKEKVDALSRELESVKRKVYGRGGREGKQGRAARKETGAGTLGRTNE